MEVQVPNLPPSPADDTNFGSRASQNGLKCLEMCWNVLKCLEMSWVLKSWKWSWLSQNAVLWLFSRSVFPLSSCEWPPTGPVGDATLWSTSSLKPRILSTLTDFCQVPIEGSSRGHWEARSWTDQIQQSVKAFAGEINALPSSFQRTPQLSSCLAFLEILKQHFVSPRIGTESQKIQKLLAQVHEASQLRQHLIHLLVLHSGEAKILWMCKRSGFWISLCHSTRLLESVWIC